MPDDINFTISIPVRTEDADNVLNAFLTLKPYANTPYQETVKDAGISIGCFAMKESDVGDDDLTEYTIEWLGKPL
jgi:hypothetical protein